MHSSTHWVPPLPSPEAAPAPEVKVDDAVAVEGEDKPNDVVGVEMGQIPKESSS